MAMIMNLPLSCFYYLVFQIKRSLWSPKQAQENKLFTYIPEIIQPKHRRFIIADKIFPNAQSDLFYEAPRTVKLKSNANLRYFYFMTTFWRICLILVFSITYELFYWMLFCLWLLFMVLYPKRKILKIGLVVCWGTFGVLLVFEYGPEIFKRRVIYSDS